MAYVLSNVKNIANFKKIYISSFCCFTSWLIIMALNEIQKDHCPGNYLHS